jgi:hypothetical protein
MKHCNALRALVSNTDVSVWAAWYIWTPCSLLFEPKYSKQRNSHILSQGKISNDCMRWSFCMEIMVSSNPQSSHYIKNLCTCTHTMKLHNVFYPTHCNALLCSSACPSASPATHSAQATAVQPQYSDAANQWTFSSTRIWGTRQSRKAALACQFAPLRLLVTRSIQCLRCLLPGGCLWLTSRHLHSSPNRPIILRNTRMCRYAYINYAFVFVYYMNLCGFVCMNAHTSK